MFPLMTFSPPILPLSAFTFHSLRSCLSASLFPTLMSNSQHLISFLSLYSMDNRLQEQLYFSPAFFQLSLPVKDGMNWINYNLYHQIVLPSILYLQTISKQQFHFHSATLRSSLIFIAFHLAKIAFHHPLTLQAILDINTSQWVCSQLQDEHADVNSAGIVKDLWTLILDTLQDMSAHAGLSRWLSELIQDGLFDLLEARVLSARGGHYTANVRFYTKATLNQRAWNISSLSRQC
ncbi:hypothetical protein BLNAU_8784 [Blattamonas nauphoetae]|uniref:Uncharacterized protein n=1 Tax=Blattamonas nauphoetae TaxID=2049346 RepID=A0ABQ9XXK4_9EUKA|nr:hypothetical protein BLNAU_8784 [Blattamonas nauphoetae]